MSATDTDTTDPQPGAADEGHAHDHPTPRDYVRIGVWLAILTAMEYSLSVIEVGPLFAPGILALMALKFGLVVAWFMHLRFDPKHFTRLMVAGLTLALVIYAAVLVMAIDWI